MRPVKYFILVALIMLTTFVYAQTIFVNGASYATGLDTNLTDLTDTTDLVYNVGSTTSGDQETGTLTKGLISGLINAESFTDTVETVLAWILYAFITFVCAMVGKFLKIGISAVRVIPKINSLIITAKHDTMLKTDNQKKIFVIEEIKKSKDILKLAKYVFKDLGGAVEFVFRLLHSKRK